MNTIDRRALEIVCGRTRVGSLDRPAAGRDDAAVRGNTTGPSRRGRRARPPCGPPADRDRGHRAGGRMDRRGVRLPRPRVRDRARGAPPRARDRTPAARARWIGPCGRPGARSVERPPREARCGPPWSTTTWGTGSSRRWLDETMTYSSALFERPGMTLEEAQLAKYRRIADVTGLRPGMRVLEIGSGWGGFAAFAANEIGCHVTTITVSKEQAAWVERMAAERRLRDRVAVRLEDFEVTTGSFDAVVSIEMIESIPAWRWPAFFRTVHDRLEPGGRAGLQIITVADRHWESSNANPDFIRRYVFPGSQVPSPGVLSARGGGRGPALDRGGRLRLVLRADARGLASPIRRRVAGDRRARVRRSLQAHVAVLPLVLRGRVQERAGRRRPDRARALGGPRPPSAREREDRRRIPQGVHQLRDRATGGTRAAGAHRAAPRPSAARRSLRDRIGAPAARG